MKSMYWQLGILGTISEFAFRHRSTKKNLCRALYKKEWVILNISINVICSPSAIHALSTTEQAEVYRFTQDRQCTYKR
jgi:hypothetical protein